MKIIESCLNFGKVLKSKFVLIFNKTNFIKIYTYLKELVVSFKKIKKIFTAQEIKKFFSRETFSGFKTVHKYLSKTDNIIIFVLLGVIILSIFFIWQNHWIKTTKAVAVSGGVLTEGIVGQPKDLDRYLTRLTNAGLTKLQPTGEVKGDLAESWQVLDGNKTFEFKLRNGINAYDLASQLQAKNSWPNIEVTTPSDNLIDFKFKQPFSPFLYISTEPIFSFGPYKVSKEDKNQITLVARDDYWQGRPYIDKIVVKFYSNESDLIKAAKNYEIMNYLKVDNGEWQSVDSNTLNMTLPRQLLLFFNVKNNDLKNKILRQNLRDGKVADKQYTFNLVTSDNTTNIKMAEKIKADWAPLKININIQKYDNVTLQKDIIPKRNYDLLLYGLDYGPDPDPYPFWHTSQISATGMNLSNYSNKNADRLLEDARQAFDFKVREDKYNQFNKILDDDVPFIKLSQTTINYVVSRDVKGLDKIFGFSETDRFLNVNQWYIKTKRVKL
ncbi:MAG: ABC transporter substrate-binding protein [Candidatus Berkelbacteria bacterium]